MKDDQEKKPPYIKILFMVIVIAIFGAAIFLVMSKSAALEPVNKQAIKMTISMQLCSYSRFSEHEHYSSA